MRALEFIIGHVTYNQAYTYKFQLKTTIIVNFIIQKLKSKHTSLKKKYKLSKTN